MLLNEVVTAKCPIPLEMYDHNVEQLFRLEVSIGFHISPIQKTNENFTNRIS